MLALVALPGCYLSHRGGAPEDAGVPDVPAIDAASIDVAVIDAGPSCTFGFRTPDGVAGMCAIGAGSIESCAEAALCVCAARGAESPSELLSCAGWDLTPRGAITLADFCEVSPPERMSLREALEGFLGAGSLIEPSPACAALPALVGVRPFHHCGAIATELCRCEPDCDLDAALGRACLDLSAEQADCIERSIFTNGDDCGFLSALPELAARCGA